jgi:hypothetical protein
MCNQEGGLYIGLPVSFRLCKEHGFYNVLNDNGSFNLILAKLNESFDIARGQK